MNDCIRGLVGTLPEGYRSVLILSELEELQDNEIAEILGVSLEAVKIRLHRARGKLRQKGIVACWSIRAIGRWQKGRMPV